MLIDIANMTVRSSHLRRHSAGPTQPNLSRRRLCHLYLLGRHRLPGWHQNATNLQESVRAAYKTVALPPPAAVCSTNRA